jgi:signal transduction histidine kinase
MRERAAEWGGELTVTSSGLDAGTVVTAVLPWPQAAAVQSAEIRSQP